MYKFVIRIVVHFRLNFHFFTGVPSFWLLNYNFFVDHLWLIFYYLLGFLMHQFCVCCFRIQFLKNRFFVISKQIDTFRSFIDLCHGYFYWFLILVQIVIFNLVPIKGGKKQVVLSIFTTHFAQHWSCLFCPNRYFANFI